MCWSVWAFAINSTTCNYIESGIIAFPSHCSFVELGIVE